MTGRLRVSHVPVPHEGLGVWPFGRKAVELT